MRYAVAIVAALALSGAHRFDRPDRRDRRTTRILTTASSDSTPPYEFRMAEADGVGMGSECDTTAATGTLNGATGFAITFARTGNAWCRKADFTWVELSTGQMRKTVGLTGQTQLGIMMERTSTNLVLHNRDLSNAAWTVSGVTCVKNATGVDGVANSASTCTAAAPSDAVWQTVTASGTRSTSFFIRRSAGTGTIRVTRDGGSNWLDITANVTSSWKRFQPQSCGTETKCVELSGLRTNVTNPTIGWDFGTAADAIELDLVQDESAFTSSPITVAGTSATRSAESLSILNPTGTFPAFSVAADVRPEYLSESYFIMPEDGTSRADFSTSNGDGSNRFELYWGGTSTASSGVCWTANTPGTFHRVAAQWTGALPYSCCDGACTVGTKHASASIPSTFSTIKIGWGAFTGRSEGVLKNICISNTGTGCI